MHNAIQRFIIRSCAQCWLHVWHTNWWPRSKTKYIPFKKWWKKKKERKKKKTHRWNYGISALYFSCARVCLNYLHFVLRFPFTFQLFHPSDKNFSIHLCMLKSRRNDVLKWHLSPFSENQNIIVLDTPHIFVIHTNTHIYLLNSCTQPFFKTIVVQHWSNTKMCFMFDFEHRYSFIIHKGNIIFTLRYLQHSNYICTEKGIKASQTFNGHN